MVALLLWESLHGILYDRKASEIFVQVKDYYKTLHS